MLILHGSQNRHFQNAENWFQTLSLTYIQAIEISYTKMIKFHSFCRFWTSPQKSAKFNFFKNQCSGNIYDSGGNSGVYSNDEDVTNNELAGEGTVDLLKEGLLVPSSKPVTKEYNLAAKGVSAGTIKIESDFVLASYNRPG